MYRRVGQSVQERRTECTGEKDPDHEGKWVSVGRSRVSVGKRQWRQVSR